MRFQHKLLVSFLTLFIVSFGTMTFLFYHHVRSILEKNIFSLLEHISIDVAEEIDTFLNYRYINIEMTASSMYLREKLKEIKENGGNYKSMVADMCKILEQIKKTDSGILELFLLNSRSQIVASTDKTQIGKNESIATFFEEKTINISDVYFSPVSGKSQIIASIPIVEDENKLLLGIIAAKIDFDEISELVKRHRNSFSKYEIYLLNNDGYFIFGTDTGKFTRLKNKLLTDNIKTSLKKQKQILKIYKNYDGNTVIGAARYLRYKSWIILVERQLKEAFIPLYELRDWFLLAGMLILFIVIAIAVKLAKNVTYPVLKLTEATKKIATGDFNINLETKNYNKINEIVTLSRHFDIMTNYLREARDIIDDCRKNLELKVEERTKELNEKIRELEKINKLSIGRELRMIELKEKIKDLETKLRNS